MRMNLLSSIDVLGEFGFCAVGIRYLLDLRSLARCSVRFDPIAVTPNRPSCVSPFTLKGKNPRHEDGGSRLTA
jgi:hypothetical protein